MESLEIFVKRTVKEGMDSMEVLDEFQRILDELDIEEKPLYLKYHTNSNI